MKNQNPVIYLRSLFVNASSVRVVSVTVVVALAVGACVVKYLQGGLQELFSNVLSAGH